MILVVLIVVIGDRPSLVFKAKFRAAPKELTVPRLFRVPAAFFVYTLVDRVGWNDNQL